MGKEKYNSPEEAYVAINQEPCPARPGEKHLMVAKNRIPKAVGKVVDYIVVSFCHFCGAKNSIRTLA